MRVAPKKLSLEILRRANLIASARCARDPAELAEAEYAIALEIGVGGDIHDAALRNGSYPQYRYMSTYQATQQLASDMWEAVVIHVGNQHRPLPDRTKYVLDMATTSRFKQLWAARRQIDAVGMSYWFYMQHALQWWHAQGRTREPTPGQLLDPHCFAHILSLWNDPEYRISLPILGDWDERFCADAYTGDAVQMAGLELLDQRLKDAERLGRDPASYLGVHIETDISISEAQRRYGPELVERALLKRQEGEAEFEDFVRSVEVPPESDAGVTAS